MKLFSWNFIYHLLFLFFLNFLKCPVYCQLLINGDFETDNIPAGKTFVYMKPSGWNVSSDNVIVIISKSDTSWGGGNNPSGNKYIGIQCTACSNPECCTTSGIIPYIEQSLVPNIKGHQLSFFSR